MKELESLIKNENWEEIGKNYTPILIANKLSFGDALFLSRKLLENDQWNDQLQSFAIELIKAVKEVYPKEWQADWRHDAYLGYAYDLRGWDYEEQFDAYKRAADRCFPINSEVLMRLAINWSCPGIYKSRMDEKDAVNLLEKALKDTPYVEGVSCLVNLYSELGQLEKRQKWEMVLKESQEKKLYAPYAFLDFFKQYGWESTSEV